MIRIREVDTVARSSFSYPARPAMTTSDSSKPDPDQALAEALREKLRALVDGQLTPKTLMQLSTTAQLARDILAVGKAPLPNRRGALGAINFGSAPGYDAPVDDEDDGGVSIGPAMATSPKAETYGATLIREAVSAYADIMSRPRPVAPHEAILAINYAKVNDMPELAKRLEDELSESLRGGVLMAHPAPAHATIDDYLPPAPKLDAESPDDPELPIVLGNVSIAPVSIEPELKAKPQPYPSDWVAEPALCGDMGAFGSGPCAMQRGHLGLHARGDNRWGQDHQITVPSPKEAAS